MDTGELEGNFVMDYHPIRGEWIYPYSLHATETRIRSGLMSHLTLINRLLTKCEVKMAGYWPSSFFFACLWME